ncbi:MAG TPA: polysaccharide deacetylase family protein [Burkholderiales bacterium]|nr:polysaccharide deacetylase family protein [Burkholderiales bacterium]
MRRALSCITALLFAAPAGARLVGTIEVHQVIALPAQEHEKVVALTLDACGGKFDADLLGYLIAHRIPATIFATKRWLDRNPAGVALLKANSDLFEIEDHGANHVAPVIGAGRSVFGIPGSPDMAHLEREILGGANAVQTVTGEAPRWYRGATAEYDPAAIKVIQSMGYRIAGFSVNADAGATLPRAAIVARLDQVKSGDIIIAHMNKPGSDTAEGLSDGIRRLLVRGFRFVRLDQAQVRPVR